MKRMIKKILDLIFINFLSLFLNFYERWVKFRINEAWGLAHLRKIHNKGENVKIAGYCRITEPENLKLGSNVRIGYNCFIFCKGGVEIHHNTILSRNITIYSANHNYEGNALPFDDTYENKKVVIEENVWIGMGVMITPGVRIGRGSIIAMGTVVSKDVAPYSIVASSKLTILKERDIERYKKNLNEKRFFSEIWPDR